MEEQGNMDVTYDLEQLFRCEECGWIGPRKVLKSAVFANPDNCCCPLLKFICPKCQYPAMEPCEEQALKGEKFAVGSDGGQG